MSLSDRSTRTIQLVSGSSVTTFEAPNKFTYRLPATGFTAGRDEVSLKSFTAYYSWANISQAKGNNHYSYVLDGAVYPVVMADGIWSFDEFNSYLQQVMRKNGHYLLDDSGSEVFYIRLVTNSVLYCLSLIVSPLPTALPTGWTNPSGLTLDGMTPQLVIPSTMSYLTGFAAGSYPSASQSTLYEVNSGIPQISDSTSLNLLCNLAHNTGFSLHTNILASFVIPQGTGSGGLISIQPTNPDWVPINGTTYTEITVELVDQLNRPIIMRDTAGVVITLNLRKRMTL